MTRTGPAVEAGPAGVGTLPNATSRALAATSTDVELVDLTVPEAHTITVRIRNNLADISAAIPLAYSGRAWAVLGYASWDAYCEAEFGEFRVRLPREERQEVVASLRESGLSTRAIASATGLGKSTVDRDLAGVPNGTPAPIDPELRRLLDDLVPKVQGTDGKSYPVAPKTPQKPRRSSLPDAGERAGWEFRRAVERLERLVDDDRFPANRDAIAASLQGHLDYALDVLPGLRRRVLGIEPMGEEQGVQFARLLAAELAVIDEEVGR